MTGKITLFAAAVLALAACAQQNDMSSPYPSGGGAVGGEGPGYCDSPPANIDDQSSWESQCMPDRG